MAESIGLDLLEAKSLLAKAKRPALKAVLSSFIREMTAKELDLLGAAEEEDDDATMEDAGPTRAAPASRKGRPRAAAARGWGASRGRRSFVGRRSSPFAVRPARPS